LPHNFWFEKDERQAKCFCGVCQACLTFFGLMRKEARACTRARRHRHGARDKCDNGLCGAALFAADTDRHSGYAGSNLHRTTIRLAWLAQNVL
jgi:hypothetical protein